MCWSAHQDGSLMPGDCSSPQKLGFVKVEAGTIISSAVFRLSCEGRDTVRGIGKDKRSVEKRELRNCKSSCWLDSSCNRNGNRVKIDLKAAVDC